jgi:hypothetical protein
MASGTEIFEWLKQSVLAQTHLTVIDAEIVTSWIISTWFRDALNIYPCLVITGTMHDATQILHCLRDYCRRAAVVSGVRRADLGALNWACETYLISEPRLDRKTTALLSSLTDGSCRFASGAYLACYSKPVAIFAGEVPGTHRIQHSVHVHVPPRRRPPLSMPSWLPKHLAFLPKHLEKYSDAHMDRVRSGRITVDHLDGEAAVVASALASCVCSEPKLMQHVVGLLKGTSPEDPPPADSAVVEALLRLSKQEKSTAYVAEIAAEANKLLDARREGPKLSAEKTGHRLRKLGVRSRRLDQAGNGVTFDNTTVAAIQQLASMYLQEDTSSREVNLHESQMTETKIDEEVM